MMRLAHERCFADPTVTAIVIDPLASNTRAIAFYHRLGYVSCWLCSSGGFSSARNAGSSRISSARADTSAPFPCRRGSRMRSTRGRRPPASPKEPSSWPSPSWAACGQRDYGEGALGRRASSGRQSWHHKAGPARSAPDMRAAVPPRRLRTGGHAARKVDQYSVSPGARLVPDDRALPRVQAEAAVRSERPAGHRA